uniref:Uncharacterized protein n=1 Tax=Setaria digitata TaxID=48799 RepID=A0A915PL10_9BILA
MQCLNADKDIDKIMNSADSLNVGGNTQEGAQEDTPRKVDTFMQVKDICLLCLLVESR